MVTKNAHQYILSSEYEKLIQKNLHNRLYGGDEDIYTIGTRGTIFLSHLIDDYRNDRILIPPHQRDDCWSNQRKKSFLFVVSNDATPPGSLEFYRLFVKGRKSALYLNDGVQRLMAALDILQYPDKYGLKEEDVEYILNNTSYPYTEKVHRSHEEALRRFQVVNNNLQLTSYQKIIGELIYCEGDMHQSFWQSFTDRIHCIVYEQGRRLVDKMYLSATSKKYIENMHLQKRHDLSVFWRFLSNEQSHIDYKVGSRVVIEKVTSANSVYFERGLSVMLAKLGKAKSTEKLDEFERIIELETALFESIWGKVIKTQSELQGKELKGLSFGASCYKWLLDVAIWRRNNGIQVPPWADFLFKFLQSTEGQTNVSYIAEDGQPARMHVSTGRTKDVQRICYIIDSDLTKRVKPRRRRKFKNKKVGWHESHRKPFATDGDGETFLEPALLNLSRGAKPVEA